jgi:hypothetical protein
VQGSNDPEPLSKAVVALCYGVWLQERAAVWGVREDVGVGTQRGSQFGCVRTLAVEVGAQNRHGLRVERDPPLLVGLQLGFD